MTELSYNDGLCHGGVRPRLWLVRGNEAVKFAGEPVKGFANVSSSKYVKNGKWSHTIFQLSLTPGVRPIHLLSPMHGIWGDKLPSWSACAAELQTGLDLAKTIVRREYPRTAERLDAVEAFEAEASASCVETETVVIAFGSPTRRQMDAGFWTLPQTRQASDGSDVVVAPGRAAGESEDVEPSWSRPVVVAPEGAKVVGSRHSPGMKGGTWEVEVIVPLRAPDAQ